MQLKKSIQAVIATVAMLAGSMTVMPTTGASAAGGKGLYTLNITNSSSTADAKGFVSAGGYTYFSAYSTDTGRSIFRVAATAGAKPELVVDVAKGRNIGYPSGMTVIGNYLFFWDDETSNYDGLRPYVFNLTTKAVTQLVDPESAKLSSDTGTKFTAKGDKVYFVADTGFASDWKLFSWTLGSADGKATVEDSMDFPFGGANTYWGGSDLPLIGDNLYIQQGPSSWNTNDGKLRMFKVTDKTWTDVQTASADFVTNNSIFGKYTYKGTEGVVVGNGGWNNPARYYFVDGNGLATQINVTGVQARNFFNIGGELYVLPSTYSPGEFALVSQTDGSWVPKMDVLHPGTDARMSSVVVVNGTLVYAAQVGAAEHETMWKWTGTGAAVQLGTVTSTKARFADFVANGGYTRVEDIGVVGDNKVIMNMYLDDAYGYEPYLIGLDGSVSLVDNMNAGSEGSDANLECSGSANGKDYLTARLPSQTSQWGVSALVEARSDGTNLLFKVFEPKNGTDPITSICAFASSGTDLYFSGYSVDDTALFKMAADGTVTRLGTITTVGRGAAVVGNKYYYWGDYESDLYVFDLTTLENKQLTGREGSITYSGYLSDGRLIGNKLYFINEDAATGDEHVFWTDLSAATYSETMIVTDPAADNDSPDNLTVLDGKLYFTDEPIDGKGDSVYKIDPATGTVTMVYDPDTENDGWINNMFAAGGDLYFSYRGDNDNAYRFMKLAGGATQSEIALPTGQGVDGNDWQLECATSLDGKLTIGGRDGSVYYLENGNLVASSMNLGESVWSICESKTTALGTYFTLPEFPYDNGPWDTELAYFGALAPKATERLGVAVNEPAATSQGNLVGPATPTVVAPGAPGKPTVTAGDARVSLSWTAPTTGDPVTSYTVVSTPAGATCVVTGTTAVCTGLTNGTSYTFKVTATNDGGSTDSTVSASVKPVAPNPDDVNVTSTDESKTLLGTYGTITYPSGSGMDIDKKGKVYLKIASQQFLTRTSGKIVFSYKVGSSIKGFTCVVKEFGSTKKLSKVPSKRITQRDPKGCQMPSAVLNAMKNGSITIKATLTVKRYLITTGKAKTSKGQTIKPMLRKLSATMGKKLS